MCKYDLSQGTEEYHHKPQLRQVVSLTPHNFQIQTYGITTNLPLLFTAWSVIPDSSQYSKYKTGVYASIWYSLPPRICISSEPFMYVQPRIFCAVAMLSTLTPWHSLRHGPMKTYQPHFSSLDKRSVNGTQMVFTHVTSKSHLSVHMSCQRYMNSNEVKTHGVVALFWSNNDWKWGFRENLIHNAQKTYKVSNLHIWKIKNSERKTDRHNKRKIQNIYKFHQRSIARLKKKSKTTICKAYFKLMVHKFRPI